MLSVVISIFLAPHVSLFVQDGTFDFAVFLLKVLYFLLSILSLITLISPVPASAVTTLLLLRCTHLYLASGHCSLNIEDAKR